MSSSSETPPCEPPELVPGLRSGSGRSYEELVRRYRGKMLGVARRMVRDPEEARDCVQEAFLLAFKNIDSFQGRSSVGRWLRGIVVHVSLMKLRYRRRRPEISIEDIRRFQWYHRPIEMKGSGHRDLDDLLAGREAWRVVREAIESLPVAYRDVLLLRYVEELDTQEAAQILSISCGAVKVRSHRARLALKKRLGASSAPARAPRALDLEPGPMVSQGS